MPRGASERAATDDESPPLPGLLYRPGVAMDRPGLPAQRRPLGIEGGIPRKRGGIPYEEW